MILSGTATDGTLGLEAIKAEGGITFAQDDSARYDSMPRSAVAAGAVDFILSAEDIATELARIAKHPARGSQETIGSRTEEEFKRILLLLRNHSSVDFSLTELHGGTVEASSGGVGQGSEFVVRLPTVVEAGTLPSRPVAPQCAPTTPLRILIVDDNRDSADMVAALLNFTGHETFTANDGLAAVEAAAKLDPDVIFLDIGLPVLNGYEAARRIREQQGLKRPPLLVALTGWGQDEDRRRSEEAGFDAHVVKPIDDAVLRRLLADLSTRRQEIPD